MTGHRRPGHESPIFIAGVANSGKTPVRRMLGAHPDLEITRRTYLWTSFYGRGGDLSDEQGVERLLDQMLNHPGVRSLQPDLDRIRHAFREGPPTHTRLFALIHAHHAERMGRRRWGNQLGAIETYADAIFADFPAAKIIHLVRDPRTRSVAQGAGRLGWETAKWRRSASIAVRNRERWADGYLVLRYETLATDPDRVLRSLCRFVGEEVHPAMLRVIDDLELHDSGVLSDTGAALVETHALDEMIALGYSRRHGVGAAGKGMKHARARASTWAGVTAWGLTASRRRPASVGDSA